MEWEKIFANHIFDKGFIFRIYKELPQLNDKRRQFKNEQRMWTAISPRKTYKLSVITWKNTQNDESSGKCKSKPDTTSHPFGWLLQHKHTHTKREREKITSVKKNIEKLEFLCTAGTYIKWYSCYGKQRDTSSKK